MRVIDILDQLSTIYSQPTPALMEQNNIAFCSPYSAVNAPEVLFHCIMDCAKMKEYARAEGVSAGFGVDSESATDLSRGIGVSEMVEC